MTSDRHTLCLTLATTIATLAEGDREILSSVQRSIAASGVRLPIAPLDELRAPWVYRGSYGEPIEGHIDVGPVDREGRARIEGRITVDPIDVRYGRTVREDQIRHLWAAADMSGSALYTRSHTYPSGYRIVVLGSTDVAADVARVRSALQSVCEIIGAESEIWAEATRRAGLSPAWIDRSGAVLYPYRTVTGETEGTETDAL